MVTTRPNNGPPFSFDGVTTRIFPLRAHRHALQRLCDTYLNLFPDEIQFRPLAPYAILSLLNYGRMSYSTETAAHYGWVAQNEVYFGVPLEWKRRVGNRWLYGAGVVAPYIFVDQGWSIEVGREVYGWPKEPAVFDRQINTWAARTPADREHLLTLATETFQTPFASERPTAVPLVEFDRAAPLSIGPSLWQAPLELDNPWWGMMTMMRESMRLWTSATRDAAMMLPMMRDAMGLLFGGKSPTLWTANLKQVRSLEDPAIATYQAITMAPMRLTSMTRAGFMGEGRMMLGDPTGGYRIRLHRHPLFPIVETLGLVVSSEEQHSDARDSAIRGVTAGVAGNTRLDRFPESLSSSDALEHGVVTLAPLFPYWLEADLEYGAGQTLSWRAAHVLDGVWHRATDARGPGNESQALPFDHLASILDTPWEASATGQGASPAPGTLGASPGLFDPTWGARTIPAPPYYYPRLTMRVLALPATKALADIVAALEVPPQVGTVELLDPARPCVLMMVTTSEEMGAQVNSAGWWWRRQVSFFIPVTWTRDGVARDVLFSAVTFADSQLAAITAREIGPQVISGELYAPPDSWLDYAGPVADRRLLWLATNVLPALDVDAEAKQRVLLEVLALDQHVGNITSSLASVNGPTVDGPAPPSSPFFTRIHASLVEGGPLAYEDLRLCILARRTVRDATNPEALCYEEWFSQNLFSISDDRHQWHISNAPLELRIHQYPDRLALVDRLALAVDRLEHVKSETSGRGWEGAIVNVISTGFAWATLDVTHECNTSLAVRSHGGEWTQPVHPAGRTPCEPNDSSAFTRLLTRFGLTPRSL